MIEQSAAGSVSIDVAPSAAPLLSIVIVSWNDWARLKDCLISIRDDTPPDVEILVVDNGSRDGTPERLRTSFPEVNLHCNPVNLGHSKGINIGFARARGEYILLLDQDTELVPGCIDTLIGYLRQHPDADLVVPRLYNSDGSVQESARRLPSAIAGLFGRNSILTRWFPDNPISYRYLGRDFLTATEPFKVESVSGACMLFARRMLADVGPWDERLYAYWNDGDWCYRLHAAGKRIVCVPAAHVYHHETSARREGKRPIRVWMFHFNAFRVYTRWRTLGYWDPRSLFAGCVLVARALVMIAYHSARTRRTQGGEPRSPEIATRPEPSEIGGNR